jgi:hypothetical protein
MKRNKLSFEEIEQARERILQEYDHYIVRFMKSRKLRNDFEDRYLSALKSRMDMSLFLHAELTTVRELQQKEEERAGREHNRAANKASESRRKKPGSFADKIIQENREKIKKYPDKKVHPDASFEIRKLFGAMSEFEHKYWPDIERCMRKIAPSVFSGPRVVLERRIFDLWSDTKEGVSPRLATYVSLFSRFPRSMRDLEREEQRFIVDSGYLLNDLYREIGLIRTNDILRVDERNFLEKMYEYVHTVIDDFRLTDFKSQ